MPKARFQHKEVCRGLGDRREGLLAAPSLVVGGAEVALIGVENQGQLHYVLSQSIATATSFFAGLVWVAFFSLAYRHLVIDAERNLEVDGE